MMTSILYTFCYSKKCTELHKYLHRYLCKYSNNINNVSNLNNLSKYSVYNRWVVKNYLEFSAFALTLRHLTHWKSTVLGAFASPTAFLHRKQDFPDPLPVRFGVRAPKIHSYECIFIYALTPNRTGIYSLGRNCSIH